MLVKLVGTWILRDFRVESDKDGNSAQDQAFHGHLIYTPDGYVSASVNRSANGERRDSLYFAKVSFPDEGMVVHEILECSDPGRIGSKNEREFKIEDDCLTLRGKGPSGSVRLTWERLAE